MGGSDRPNEMTAVEQIVALNRQQTYSETDPFTERRYRQFGRRFSSNTRDVLDVGCNIGRGGAALKAMLPGLRITGLDCVPERLAALDARVYQQKICGFAQTVPSATESFDAIVAGEFIEHLPPDLVFPALCEFFRQLRLRGLLVLTTPNPRYLKNRLRGASVLGGAHVSQHYISNLKRRLRDVGFSRIRISGSGRVSSIIGEHFPYRSIYGSYLADARKW
jgi:2-polyprenyl-3-methyl-5-hydroxy-6-metoxy-1,4-benzoquinol methylase